MPQPELSTLISRVRSLLGDTTGTAWTDEQIIEALNDRREEARYMELDALESVAPGGAVEYKDFVAHLGQWDDAVELTDGTYTVLTPALSDNMGGRWSFDDEPDALPVMLTGFTYDIYGACGDLVSSGAGGAASLAPAEDRVTARHDNREERALVVRWPVQRRSWRTSSGDRQGAVRRSDEGASGEHPRQFHAIRTGMGSRSGPVPTALTSRAATLSEGI